MTKTHIIETDAIFLLILAAVVGSSFAFFFGHKSQAPRKFYLPVLESSQVSQQTPSSTPAVVALPIVTSQVSPDGTHKLSMTITANKDLTKTYIFETSDGDVGNKQTIYTMTSADSSMEIPFNTWSPDNKYVFLELIAPTGTQAIVMSENGTPLTDTDQTQNVTSLFNAKNTGNTYEETTGWASETLLIVNANTPTGNKQSYWFEVPSKAIIALSSEF